MTERPLSPLEREHGVFEAAMKEWIEDAARDLVEALPAILEDFLEGVDQKDEE